MSVGQTGQASLWGGQMNIVLQVRAPRRSRIIFPVSVSAISYFFLLHKIDIPGDDCPAASPVADHCYSPVWPMTGRLPSSVTSVQSPDNLGQIAPLPSFHHNNIFPAPSLPWYPALLYFSSRCIPSVCLVSLLLSPLSLQGKNVFSSMQCKRLKLKLRIESARRYFELIYNTFYNTTCLVQWIVQSFGSIQTFPLSASTHRWIYSRDTYQAIYRSNMLIVRFIIS